MSEDWPILLSFFPDTWADLATSTNALKGLRQDKDAENYIRLLLMHFGCGYSMRETVVRAKMAHIASLSDVAFLKRLRKSKDWLRGLCLALLAERGVALGLGDEDGGGFQVRLFDATNVKEPGKTGSLWRIHYSVLLPSLTCDFFKLTETKGQGTGESFFQFSIKKGDYIVADRGYSTAAGIHHVVSRRAHVMVRVNTTALPLLDQEGQPFPLLAKLAEIKGPGIVRSWRVLVPSRRDTAVAGRICVIRKTEEAIKLAHEKLRRQASKKQHSLQAETLEYAKFVIVFTTFPEDSFSDHSVLDWYRLRWQVELVFKRFKTIAELGHLPKHSDDSSKAWLYGKLFVALLTEKLVHHAASISPWGYFLEEQPAAKRLA